MNNNKNKKQKQAVRVSRRPVYTGVAAKRGTASVQVKLDVHAELKVLCAELGVKMEDFASDAIYVAIDNHRMNNNN